MEPIDLALSQVIRLQMALHGAGATNDEVDCLADSDVLSNAIKVLRSELKFTHDPQPQFPAIAPGVTRDKDWHVYLTLPERWYTEDDCERVLTELRCIDERRARLVEELPRSLKDRPDYGVRRRVVLCRLQSLKEPKTDYIRTYAEVKGWKLSHWTVIHRLREVLPASVLEQTGFTYVSMLSGERPERDYYDNKGFLLTMSREGFRWPLRMNFLSLTQRNGDQVSHTGFWESNGSFVFEVPED